MRHAKKVSSLATAALARKSALSASAAARGAFPAWIVADESGVAFPAKTLVTPRVRDGLVLRTVAKTKSPTSKPSPDGHSAR